MAGLGAHGDQHGRGLEGLGGAGRARVDSDAGAVETEQHRLGLDSGHPEADQIGQPVSGSRVRVAHHVDAGYGRRGRRDPRAETRARGALFGHEP